MVRISEILYTDPRPINQEYWERLIMLMGREIDAVNNQYIFFGRYKLYHEWISDFERNFVWICLKYRVWKEELEDFQIIADRINREMKTVKAIISPSRNAIGHYRLELAVTSFLSGNDMMYDLNVMQALIAHFRAAEKRVIEMKKDISQQKSCDDFNNDSDKAELK